jgi:uncharacterized membrane protein YvlD (DUF360 family)
MPVIGTFQGFRWFRFLKDAALRTGVYAGVSLSLIFSAWILVANRAPYLEPLAMERNIIAAALLALFAAFPILRFFSCPSHLLTSGILAWGIFTFTYRIFCFKFDLLEEHYTAAHVFVLGAIIYFVVATISWIGTIIWRVHATSSSQTHH